MTDDFFRNRLDQIIELRHSLAVLANRMPWQEIEASLAQRWARQVKASKKIDDLDLVWPGFGSGRWRRLKSRASAFAHLSDGGAALPQTCLQRKR